MHTTELNTSHAVSALLPLALSGERAKKPTTILPVAPDEPSREKRESAYKAEELAEMRKLLTLQLRQLKDPRRKDA